MGGVDLGLLFHHINRQRNENRACWRLRVEGPGEAREVALTEARLTGATFSRDGRLLAGVTGAEILVFDTATGARLHRFRLPFGDATGAASFAPDGETLVTGQVDGCALVWNVSRAR